MEKKANSRNSTLFRIMFAVIALIILSLGVVYYLDKSWSNSLKDKDIITRSTRDSATGLQKDTSYLAPHSMENFKYPHTTTPKL
jgi:hypothetical protein